jgi:hypothetical protein
MCKKKHLLPLKVIGVPHSWTDLAINQALSRVIRE